MKGIVTDVIVVVTIVMTTAEMTMLAATETTIPVENGTIITPVTAMTSIATAATDMIITVSKETLTETWMMTPADGGTMGNATRE